MRYSRTVCALCVLAAAGFAGLSGTYTIKPDGSGDFPDFQQAANVLVDSGISGDCIFEAYTGYYAYGVDLYSVAGNDSWSITFRSAAGEHPVVAEEAFNCADLKRFTLENLTFEYAWPVFAGCRDCRITNCRFAPIGDFLFHGCSLFVIAGNVIRELGETEGMLLENCSDFTVASNFLLLSTPNYGGGALKLTATPRLKLYYNSLWCPSVENDVVGCSQIEAADNADIRNNVFFLARGCDTFSYCVEALVDSLDTISIDYNCYYVESAGFVGHVPDTFVDFAGWQALGFDLHGRYGDPLFVDTSDLHLRQGSPCIGAGVPIAGFEFDIDGDPRDPLHPDLGADEFTGGAVDESHKPQASSPKPGPTILCGASGVARLSSCVVFDAMGRRVLDPKPGIYFVRDEGQGAGDAGRMRKVLVTR